MFWWVLSTLGAATLQIIRTGLQKKLSDDIDIYSATWVRYAFACPLALLVLVWLGIKQPTLLDFNSQFLLYCLFASIAQIIATLFLLRAFNYKNFAVGTTYAQTEGIFFALIGLIFLGNTLPLIGTIGLGCAVVGIIFMAQSKTDSMQPGATYKAIILGLSAGLFFALTILNIRFAYTVLEKQFVIELSNEGWLVSILTLAVMVLMQTILLIPFIKRQVFRQLAHHIKIATLIGLTSFFGSFLWFLCFYLANPAYVKTLALIELPLAYVISSRAFNESPNRYEVWGMVFVAVAAALVIVASI